MKIEKFKFYLADLNPSFGTEPGKVRPVIVIQTDLLNPTHLSTLICPLTTSVATDVKLLRVHVSRKESGLENDSDILVDQIRAVDNRRFIKFVGRLNVSSQEKLLESLKILILE